MLRIIVILIALVANRASFADGILINEVMPSNGIGFMDEDSDDPDWLELYNSSKSPVNLKNYRISDKNDFVSAFILPDTVLKPGERLIVFCSGKNRLDDGKYSLQAQGTGISVNTIKDEFRFHYKKISGDFDISFRINSFGGLRDNSTIGVILRENFEPDCKYAGLFGIKESKMGYWFQYRREAGTFPAPYWGYTLSQKYPDIWLRLKRVGDSIYSMTFEERCFWKPVYKDVCVISEEAYIGIAYSSGDHFNPANFIISEILLNDKETNLNSFETIDINCPAEGKSYHHREIHSDFELSKSSETIYLRDPAGNLIDEFTFLDMHSDVSIGRCPDGSLNIKYFDKPSPGTENKECKEAKLELPFFSIPGGFYKAPLSIALNTDIESNVYYTLDGSIPNEMSKKYSAPINIEKTTVLRAVSIKSGYVRSNIETKTYFINESKTLPVISYSADPNDMFDEDSGIYTEKNIYFDLEIPAHFEIFNENGAPEYSSDCGAKLHGHLSRQFPQKSIRVYARTKYDNKVFKHEFFPGNPVKNYRRLLFRNGGTDWTFSMFRDGFFAYLLENLHEISPSDYRPAVMYINGKYWGIQNLRERIDNELIAERYGLNPDSINMMEDWGVYLNGTSKPWHDSYNKVIANNPLESSFYNLIESVYDLDNLTDYLSSEIFSGNFDWPWKNLKYWHSDQYDGKWRWIVNDMDYSFGVGTAWAGIKMYKLARDTSTVMGKLFDHLLNNAEYRNKYLNRSADLMNSEFLAGRAIKLIDSISEKIETEIPLHRERWGEITANEWDAQIRRMKRFATERPDSHRNYTVQHFGLEGISDVNLTINKEKAGRIRINSITPNNYPWAGKYYINIPVEFEAIANEGYKFKAWGSPELKDSGNKIVIYPGEEYFLEAIFEDSNPDKILLVNEIMYRPSDDFDCDDWFELYNSGKEDIDLSDWSIKDNNDNHIFEVPQDTKINKGGYLVFCRDTFEFRRFYPDNIKLIGDFDFGFGTEDAIRLYDSDNKLMDIVSYTNESPWPEGADQSGYSIELIQPEYDNNDGTNWKISKALGGSPGYENSTLVDIPLNQENNDITLYPIPAGIYCDISLNNKAHGDVKISVCSITGECIMEYSKFKFSGKNILRVPLTSLQNGIYIVKITLSDGTTATRKLPVVK